jgi:hypothetical protein
VAGEAEDGHPVVVTLVVENIEELGGSGVLALDDFAQHGALSRVEGGAGLAGLLGLIAGVAGPIVTVVGNASRITGRRLSTAIRSTPPLFPAGPCS